MTVWWTFFVFCVLICVEAAAPTPFVHKYKHSFHLTRTTRNHVQRLLRIYKEQQMGDVHFEDRSRYLRDLPSLSTDFYRWLSLSDWDRLQGAVSDMQVYWLMLEKKRKQLEREQKEQVGVQATQTSLIRSIQHIQWDLRDLINEVSSQMRLMENSWIKPIPAEVHENSSGTVWDRRVEGYIILRDLDLYLTKLARDFLLLASKTRAGETKRLHTHGRKREK